jgi:hypothetical protein
VNTALTMLAQDDAVAATPTSLAEVAAVGQPGALSCTFAPVQVPPQHKGSDGLTPRADAVRSNVLDVFGKLQVAGSPAAAAPAAIALTVSLAPINASKLATGWVLANWLVARGSTYGLGGISFDAHTWRPVNGWNAIPAVATAGPAASAGGSPLNKATATATQAPPAHDPDQIQIVVN